MSRRSEGASPMNLLPSGDRRRRHHDCVRRGDIGRTHDGLTRLGLLPGTRWQASRHLGAGAAQAKVRVALEAHLRPVGHSSRSVGLCFGPLVSPRRALITQLNYYSSRNASRSFGSKVCRR